MLSPGSPKNENEKPQHSDDSNVTESSDTCALATSASLSNGSQCISSRDDSDRHESDDPHSSGTASPFSDSNKNNSETQEAIDPHSLKTQNASEEIGGDANCESGHENEPPLEFPASGADNSEEADLLLECDKDRKLLRDTYTFLMTGRYPLENPQRTTAQEAAPDDCQPARTTRILNADPDYACLPFWAGLLVVCGQLAVYSIVLVDAFDNGDLPPGASKLMRVAQVFAMIVTIYTQSDFIDGTIMCTEYKLNAEQFKEKKITTYSKYHISACLRIVSGNFGVVSTFVLVMYSTEVVDLLLNFTAMEFVATLDDSFFRVASEGFLGLTLEKKATLIEAIKYKHRPRRGSLRRMYAYGSYTLLVFAAFIVVMMLQRQRIVGVDNVVYVQFDYTEAPELFGISGVYKGCTGFKSKEGTGTVVYVDVSYDECPKLSGESKPTFPPSIFVYCWERNNLPAGWVYVRDSTDSPCDLGSFTVRSFTEGSGSDDHSFDLLSHSTANWLLQRSEGGETLLDFVFLESVTDFRNTFKSCEDGLVRLDSEGDSLLYRPLNSSFFEFDGKTNAARDYGLIYRPIFTRPIEWQHEKFEVILFEGLRWMHLFLSPRDFADDFSSGYDDIPECSEIEDCWFVFVKYFHRDSSWIFDPSITQIRKISTPMRFLKPSDTGIPDIGLKWYEAMIAEGADGRLHYISEGKEAEVEREGERVESDGSIDSTIFRESIGLKCKADDCPDGGLSVQVEITTDRFPSETQVLLFFANSFRGIENLTRIQEISSESDQGNGFDISAGTLTALSFREGNSNHLFNSCVPRQECVQVVVVDTLGDGFSGSYSFSHAGVAAAITSQEFRSSCRSYQIGPGCAARTSAPMSVPTSAPSFQTSVAPDNSTTTRKASDAERTHDECSYRNDILPLINSLENVGTFFDDDAVDQYPHWIENCLDNLQSEACVDNTFYDADDDTSRVKHLAICRANEVFTVLDVFGGASWRVLAFHGQSMDDLSSLSTSKTLFWPTQSATKDEGKDDDFSLVDVLDFSEQYFHVNSRDTLADMRFDDLIGDASVLACVPSDACIQVVAMASEQGGDGCLTYGDEDEEFISIFKSDAGGCSVTFNGTCSHFQFGSCETGSSAEPTPCSKTDVEDRLDAIIVPLPPPVIIPVPVDANELPGASILIILAALLALCCCIVVVRRRT